MVTTTQETIVTIQATKKIVQTVLVSKEKMSSLNVGYQSPLLNGPIYLKNHQYRNFKFQSYVFRVYYKVEKNEKEVKNHFILVIYAKN